MNSRKKKMIIGFVILLLIVPLCVFAKYMYGAIYEHYLTTKEFYFYSDYLDINTSEYRLDNWSGAGNYNIRFQLFNYQNDMRYTENDIEYKITYECSNNVSCSTDLTGDSDVLVGGSKNYNTINLIITPVQELHVGDEVTVFVKASTNNIFDKEVMAKYIIRIKDIDYNIVDSEGSMYAVLNVVNSSNNDKNITLTFDNSVVNIDTSNKLVIEGSSYSKDEYISSVTLNLGAHTDHSIYFYKNDVDQDYSYPSVNNSIISIGY